MAKAINTVYTGSSVGLGTLLTVLFVGLKLGGVIAWPWIWVLAPTWIPIAIALAVVIGSFLLAGLVFLIGLIAASFDK